jgi:hypothetical protein
MSLGPRSLSASFIAPCLPTSAPLPPSGESWLHEIKHDGFRVIARKVGERVKLYSRPGDLTWRFPLIVEAVAKLRLQSCIIELFAGSLQTMPVRRRDLKLRACMNAFTGHGELPELKTQSIRPVGAAYERNVRRVYSLILFPPAAVNMAITVQRVIDKIDFQHPDIDSEVRQQLIEEEVRRQMSNFADIMQQEGDRATEAFDTQQSAAFQILSAYSPQSEEGPEAWMAAQIIATWTAFEAMAEDLWEAALNAKPNILAKLAGRDKSKPKAGDDPKRIKLDFIYKYRFKIEDRMGTIFIEDQRYKFDSLKGIRQAYKDAFSQDYGDIDNILNAKGLDALSLIRNNLVHDGGIVDEGLLDRTADLPSAFTGLSIGDHMPLDGDIVADVAGGVMKHGHDLVVAVDNWLVAH